VRNVAIVGAGMTFFGLADNLGGPTAVSAVTIPEGPADGRA